MSLIRFLTSSRWCIGIGYGFFGFGVDDVEIVCVCGEMHFDGFVENRGLWKRSLNELKRLLKFDVVERECMEEKFWEKLASLQIKLDLEKIESMEKSMLIEKYFRKSLPRMVCGRSAI